jgi:hypothetical protein
MITQQIIEIYVWLAASLLMVIMAAIAFFYQKKFGVRTFYYIFLVPIIIFLVSGLHLIVYQTYFSESIELLGSISSYIASFYLYRTMVGVKK